MITLAVAEKMAVKAFDGMTIDGIDEILKAVRKQATEAKAAIRKAIKADEKAVKEAKKAEAEKIALEVVKTLKENDEVQITVGSGKNVEIVDAVFVKMTEKRFTVMFEGKKRSVMFSKFVGLVVSDEVETEIETEDDFIAEETEGLLEVDSQ